MTAIADIELKVMQITILSIKLVIILTSICEIGITLHTSAEACAWNTNVHFA